MAAAVIVDESVQLAGVADAKKLTALQRDRLRRHDVRQRAAEHPGGVVDLSIGTPVDDTPALLGDALAAAGNAPGYPAALGTAALRTAAAGWLERAAHADHAAAQFQLAVMFCTGQGVPKDLPQAIIWYDLAAQMGHKIAQYNLAVMLSNGQGCEPDPARGYHWFEKAAAQGMPEAQLALGDMCHSGSGVPKDDTAARRWYQEAARSGNQAAEKRLQALG